MLILHFNIYIIIMQLRNIMLLDFVSDCDFHKKSSDKTVVENGCTHVVRTTVLYQRTFLLSIVNSDMTSELLIPLK